MISYIYNEKKLLIEVKGRGLVKAEDIIKHYQRLRKDNFPTKRLRVLIDAREVTFQEGTEKEMYQFKDLINDFTTKHSSIREAIIVDEPYSTAIASLYQYYTSGIKNYSFGVFASTEGARNWLHII